MIEPDLAPLFEPLRLGPLTLRNRFAMPAMQIGLTENCGPGERAIDYLRARAEGGVGLVFSESCAPDHPSAYWQPGFCVLNADTRLGWARMVEAIKGAGAAFMIQLWHPGSQRLPIKGFTHADSPTLSPSGLVQAGRENGRAMSAAELDDIAAAFLRAAEQAKALGADGIELHGAHGYLLDQFLWAETNQREDGFGGEGVDERARFPLALVSAIRAACGPHFAISLRFSQFKEVDYGAKVFASPAELERFGQLAKAAGVDVLNVSSRRFTRPEWPELEPELGIAGWARRLSGLPVMTTGSVGLTSDVFADLFDKQDPGLRLVGDLAELARRMDLGEFDLVGVGRMHIANPDFVARIAAGEADQLRLYQKAVDLKHLVGSMEPGLVEEGRKVEEI